jgi:hypothetical protein
MTKQVEGTIVDLYRMRAAFAAGKNAVNALESAGLDSTQSRELYNDLGTTQISIPVPCIVCKKGFPVAVFVADEGWPQAVLCEDCNAKIMEDVAKLPPLEGERPRRRRRTKAEIEAARAAEQESKNA